MDAHYKYNHCSEAILKKTLKYYGLKPTGKMLTCNGCMIAKGRRVGIPKIDLAKATKPAQRLQLDLSGPFFATTAGSRYWLKIMCQFSRKCFDYFIREKNEVVTKFEHLIDLLTAANFTVEYLRCDDAGEHQAVETLCEKRGIKIEFTGANTPQRNGIVERRFLTDGERATAAMVSAGLPSSMRRVCWAEFAKSTSITSNTICNSVNEIPPDTMFYGQDSKLPKNLMELGRIGYVSKDRTIKNAKFVSDTADKVIMVGYAHNHSRDTYRVYRPRTRGILQTRNVRWADWTPTKPGDDVQMESLRSDKDEPVEEENYRRYFDDNSDDDYEDYDTDNSDESSFLDIDLPDDEAGRMMAVDWDDEEEENPNPNSKTENEDDKVEDKDDATRAPNRRLTRSAASSRSQELRSLKTTLNNQEITGRRSSRRGPATRSKYVSLTDTKSKQPDLNMTFVYDTTLNSDPKTPKSFKDIAKIEDSEVRKKWYDAVRDEFDQFFKRKSWIKTKRKDLPAGRKPIPVKHVFKIKDEPTGERFKDRVIVKGYMSIPGIDYTEKFSPVMTDATVRIFIAIYLHLKKYKPEEKWCLWHIDYESAFLNADLLREVFVDWPEGLVELGLMTQEEFNETCARLGTSMYGNVDAALLWFNMLTGHMTDEDKMNMKRSLTDPCVIYEQENERLKLMTGVNVDDTLALGREEDLQSFVDEISKRFNVTVQKEVKKHLGVDYEWGEDEFGPYAKASMKKYEREIWELFESLTGKTLGLYPTPAHPNTTLVKCKEDEQPIEETKYRSITGKAMHWNRKIGLECNNSMREISRFMKHPGEQHWKALERLCGYVKAEKFDHLLYRAPDKLQSKCWFDANFGQNPDDRRSVSGCHETIDGKCAIHTTSQGQKTVSKSTSEAEYTSASYAGNGVVFTTNLIEEVMGKDAMHRPGEFIGDNQGCLYLMNNMQVGQRTKHIDIKAHWIRDVVKKKVIKTKYTPTEEMIADIDTKNCDQKTFEKHARAKRYGNNPMK